jgi:hypothetical protein
MDELHEFTNGLVRLEMASRCALYRQKTEAQSGERELWHAERRLPHRANIENGAGIDLNPGFAKAFGLHPPFLIPGVRWEWGE